MAGKVWKQVFSFGLGMRVVYCGYGRGVEVGVGGGVGGAGPKYATSHLSLPTLCFLNALSDALNVEAPLTGDPLRQLMKSKEEKFEQRFSQAFGQVSRDDLPAGIPCSTACVALSKVGEGRGEEGEGGRGGYSLAHCLQMAATLPALCF